MSKYDMMVCYFWGLDDEIVYNLWGILFRDFFVVKLLIKLDVV